jgi:uncharacterized protein YecE (DUF72 family)
MQLTSMDYYIGTSGWSYANWQETFYPVEVKPAARLAYYAKHFNTVETNSTFYRWPKANVWRHWHDLVPDQFVFSIKAPRLITHYRKLKNCHTLVNDCLQSLSLLKNKCGPVLFQLPPTLTKQTDVLQHFIQGLPGAYRYVFEFRHSSWHCDEIYQLLNQYRLAFCVFELGQMTSPVLSSCDFCYVRLHGHPQPYRGRYTTNELQKWSQWLMNQQRVGYIYFDNTDEQNYAIINAGQLAKLLGQTIDKQ